jgi:hypothetical protein
MSLFPSATSWSRLLWEKNRPEKCRIGTANLIYFKNFASLDSPEPYRIAEVALPFPLKSKLFLFLRKFKTCACKTACYPCVYHSSPLMITSSVTRLRVQHNPFSKNK